MSATKYIYSEGLALNEQEDMDKLSEYAKKGWVLEQIQCLGYKLKKEKPRNITYTLDYRKEADEEYFAFFEAAGWSHVCSANTMHVFCASEGTNPIYTDSVTVIEKYEIQRKMMGKLAFPTLIVTLMLLLLTILSGYGVFPKFVGGVSALLGYGSVIVLIFTGLPYISYSFKLTKLRNH